MSFKNFLQSIIYFSSSFDSPERIRAIAKTDEEYMVLFAKVLIHELAHAKLDFHDENKAYGPIDNFFKWIEEPMANYITLETFEEYDRGMKYHHRRRHYGYNNSKTKNAFEIVNKFILRQPSNYAIAAHLYNETVLRFYYLWRSHKDELGLGANKQKIQSKQAWLNEISTTASPDVLRKIFDALLTSSSPQRKRNLSLTT